MQYRRLGKTGWSVSVIGLGTWNNSGQWGEVSEEAARDTVRAALDAGVNFIDTADAYGDPQGLSETRVGKALRGVPRDSYFLATKVGNWAGRFGHNLPYTHVNHVIGCCHASLYRLGLDHIDLYQNHWGNTKQIDVFLEAFDILQKQGLIRAFGVSTGDVETVKAYDTDGRCAAVQLDYSFLNRDAERELLPYCGAHGIGTIIRGPLAKGMVTGVYDKDATFTDQVRSKWNQGKGREAFLAGIAEAQKLRPLVNDGRTMAQAALQFVASHDAVTTIIAGAKSPAQARANAAAGDAVLTEQELATLG